MENFAVEFMTKLDGKLTPEQMRTVLAELEMFSANFDIEKKVTDIVPYQDCVPECYKVYLVSKKIEGMSPQSLRTYKCNLDDFFQTVNKPLNQISVCTCSGCQQRATPTGRLTEKDLSFIRSLTGV